MTTNAKSDQRRITEHDVYLLKEGNHFQLYRKMGAHVMEQDGVWGTYFCVWAPTAAQVSVIGDFNGWSPGAHPMNVRWDGSGLWELFLPDVGHGMLYKFHIVSTNADYSVDKGDPYAHLWELPPNDASVVWDQPYEWNDEQWMADRHRRNAHDAPISVYELHVGSWKRVPNEGNRSLSYRELAHELGEYLTENGFTHVELLPVMEHPFYGSWGYQTLGYFAPTGRYGSPEDFRYFVDHLHRKGIGVILDWVPSHFPSNEYGLGYFDGSHLYEHADPREGWHPDWNSYIFNVGRNEVRCFLISSAMYWLEEFHVDGLRVDAVASMLYRDYSREQGEWVPNEQGGRENLQSIAFLRRLNEAVYERHPDVMTVAEESTSWPMVSRPTYAGGLGFGMKWNMGWMHDTLEYFRKDPIYRSYHHGELTFSMMYAFSENFVLAFSHDEVVHGKGSMLGKMPGDDWQKFANLRLMYGYMFTHPGKKLLFMGGEIGQWREWNHDGSVDWHLLDFPPHQGIRRWVADLNATYRSEPALYVKDFDREGFQWVNCHDYANCVLSYLRYGGVNDPILLAVCNFTPAPRYNYRVGVPRAGHWQEVLNSDAPCYGGSGVGNFGGVVTSPLPFYDAFDFSLSLTLPPLGAVIFRWDANEQTEEEQG